MIIHGTKRVEKQLGWVAEFCAICRQPRASRLILVGMKSHLYFVALGGLKDARHEIECEECKIRLLADPASYAGVLKKRPADFTQLVEATMPNMPEQLGERLALEKHIRENAGDLDAFTRQHLLFEAFQVLNAALDKHTDGGTHLDGPTSIGCFGTLIFGTVLVMLMMELSHKWHETLLSALFIGVTLGTVYTFVRLAMVLPRKMRREIIPKLVRAIGPLRPTQDELKEVIARCKTIGLQIGKRTKLTALWNALQDAQLK